MGVTYRADWRLSLSNRESTEVIVLTMKFVLLVLLFSFAACSYQDERGFCDNLYEAAPPDYQTSHHITSPRPRNNDDTPELIRQAGYPAETHWVTTPDGYILAIHRIPYGRDGPFGTRPVIFVQHGLLCSSADWVMPTPSKGLGYILCIASM